MPTIQLTTDFIRTKLVCPDGMRRIEFCDSEPPRGMYVEVRAASPGRGTYYLRYKDATGKTCHAKLGRTEDLSLAEARRQAKDLKAKIQLGADPSGEAKARKEVPTLTEFWRDSYLPFSKQHKRSWTKDESLFRLRVEPTFGHLRLNEIKRQPVQNFLGEIASAGMAPATADHYVKLIRQMLNKAVEWDVIASNPISRIKLFNADNRKENYLEGDDLRRLLQVLRTNKNRTVCRVALFLLSTGARLNEALRATWDQIDRANRVWRIPASNSKSKRVRSVPLNDAAMEVLAELDSGESKPPRLFISQTTGRPLNHVHKVWEDIRAEAGLPQLRMHDLRHQFASFLVNDGRSLYEVQKILGHSSHSVTERYAHLSMASLMDASNSATAALRGTQVRAA